MAVDTAKVTQRRRLRFNTLDEVRRDAEQLVAAERAGRLRRSGNWTLGQIFGHLAAFIDYAYDGYPPSLANPPWFVKLFLRMRKNKFLRGPLPAGVKIPRVKGGTTGAEPIPTDEGYAKLTRALERLAAAPPAAPNIVFGPLTHEQWCALHQRHAELHLGFVSEGSQAQHCDEAPPVFSLYIQTSLPAEL